MKFPFKRQHLPVFSWCLYDFANTIFSMNIISLYFALWVIQDKGGKDIHYGLVYSASMLIVILLGPLLGRLADVYVKRRLFLIIATVVCIASTALIGSINLLGWGLALFFIASGAYQLALVFYDSLLPSVASHERVGSISGSGVALGYLGAIIGILLVSLFVNVGGEVFRERAFIPTAGLFLLFSLPCFLWVKEQGSRGEDVPLALWSQSWGVLTQHAGVLPYLITMFLIQNAVTTIILFMGVYVVQVGHFTQTEVNTLFITSTVAAIAAAACTGKLVDRLGPLRVFRWMIPLWIIALLIAAVAQSSLGLWVAGCLVGIGLGGVWTSSRPLLLTFIPKEKSATFFGFNVLVGRFSALLGPLLWGLIVWALEPLGSLRYRVAIGSLTIFLGAALLTMRKIPDRSRAEAGS